MEQIAHLASCLKTLEGAYAPNTLRSYYSDVRAFVDWSNQRNETPFPLISSDLSNYIEFIQENYSYSTIRRRISALRRINTLLGFEDGTHTEEVYLTIRRAKRSKCLD